ncbi:hepatitis A virus cellular receptor 2 homolog [Polymixia lowei]
MKTLTISDWLFLLCLLIVGECIDQKVVSVVGQSATLPCKYNIKELGALTVCWGRGAIPNSGCANEIITTDGSKVQSRKSDRYQLQGQLDVGDVSVTILNVSEKDSGQYGCRVQVTGWFNDKKHYIYLTVQKAPEPTTSSTPDNVTSTEQALSNHTQGHMTSTVYWDTSSSQAEEEESSSSLAVVLVCVLLVLVVLATGFGVIFMTRRCWKLSKTLQIPQQSSSSVRFRSSVSSLGLSNRGSVVENVYQMDGVNDYEYCP